MHGLSFGGEIESAPGLVSVLPPDPRSVIAAQPLLHVLDAVAHLVLLKEMRVPGQLDPRAADILERRGRAGDLGAERANRRILHLDVLGVG